MTGYSGTPLIRKLGFKSGQLVYFKSAPDEYFEALGPLPDSVFIAKKLNRPVDAIHAFYTKRADLEKDILLFQQYLELGGMLWVSWPKKTAVKGLNTKIDVVENTFRDILLPFNLVDVKVAAITPVWSGLKFVWRKW